MANYPATLPGLSTSSNNATPSTNTHPSLHNTVNDEVNAIAATLGTTPTYLRGGGGRSLLSLGCVGNGSTDDEVAIQAALDAQRTDGLWLDGEGKTYAISKPLILPQTARLRNVGGILAIAGYGPADATNAMVMNQNGYVGAFSATAVDDTVTATAHGMNTGHTRNRVVLKGASLPSPLVAGRLYWAVQLTANTFKLSATQGGSAIDLTANGSGTAYCNVAGLGRVYLTDVLVNGGNRAGVNGLLLTQQQPAEIHKLRVDNCPGYGMNLAGQQAVFTNFESINCFHAVELDGMSFLYVYGFNAEQCDRAVLGIGNGTSAFRPSEDVTGNNMCGFWGVHIEMSDTPATTSSVPFDFPTYYSGLTFDNVQVSPLDGQKLFWFHGAGGSYVIRDLRATSTNQAGTTIVDADHGTTLDMFTDFGRYVSELRGLSQAQAANNDQSFVVLGRSGRVLRFGGDQDGAPSASSRPSSSQTADQHAWYDSAGSGGSGVNKAGFFHTKKTSAPADGDLVNSQLMWYWDAAAGAMVVKGKKSDGTVVTTTLGAGGGGASGLDLPALTATHYKSVGIGVDGASGAYNDRLIYVPLLWVNRSRSFDRIGIDVTTAGGGGTTLRFGLYSDSSFRPGARITDYGTVAVDTTGFKEITISPTLTAGTYWVAVLFPAASGPLVARVQPVTLSTHGTTSTQPFGLFGADSETTLSDPAVIHYQGNYGNYWPAVMLRAS